MLRDAERPEVCGGKSAAALFCAAVGHCRCHTPRDGDQRAGHRAGLVGRQEQHDRGELGRLHPVVESGLRHVAAVGRRVDDRGQHRVDRHAFQLQFLGQAFGQPMHGRFAGGVGAHSRRGLERRSGADVDDAAGAALQKIGERRLAGVQRGLQVQRPSSFLKGFVDCLETFYFSDQMKSL